MPEPSMSRRAFLAAGLGTAALLGGCDIATNPTTNIAPTATSIPPASPFLSGPYQVDRVILGQDAVAATDALPQFFSLSAEPRFPTRFLGDPSLVMTCSDGTVVGPHLPLPASILAAVYYPYNSRDHRAVPTPNPLHFTSGPFPVLLYAHAFRTAFEGCAGPHTANLDFTSVEGMLRHVASYGCVCVVPDLSWLPGGVMNDPQTYSDVVLTRTQVLARYFAWLLSLNAPLFAQQLDLTRLVLVGHSTGGPSVVEAGRLLTASISLQSLSYGLIAPAATVLYGAQSNLLVLKGTRDTVQVGDAPEAQYNAAGPPKTLVTIPGANHFGYTDICPADNSCAGIRLNDNDGTITRDAQQLVGASYLAALVRYYALGDGTARPYLTGEKLVEGLETIRVSGITVQAQGLPLSTPTPSRPTPAPNH